MKLKVLGSSSRGNCYLLESDDSVLAIEAGIPFREVKQALGWDISRLSACIVSHRHGDHAAHVKDFVSAGVTVFALPDVFTHAGMKNRVCCKEVWPGKGYRIGRWSIIPINVVHDVPCVGYIIEHPEMGRTVFVTDTMMLEYRIPRVSHYMVECNYADDVLQRNIDNGSVLPMMRERLHGTHMELETTKGIIAGADRSCLENVVLIHLSDGNSDEKRFVAEIEAVCGVPTYAADKGMEIDFSLLPF